MLRLSSIRPFCLLTAILAAGCPAACVPALAQTAAPVQEVQEKISSFGQYAGYSEPAYDGWVRSSRYLTVSDGTRLAIDVFRPTRAGKVATEKLPVVWTHHRYRCAARDVEEGKTYAALDNFEWLPEVLRHGYVVACADARGSGASFGTFEGMFNPRETQDADEIIEWLGTQSWSNGNVGMYGGSYLGMNQYMAAGRKPPHLKALFPEVGGTDMYELLYKGGIFHGPFIERWTNLVREIDVDQPAAPVDEDRDGALLKAAVEQHKSNRNAAELYAGLPYRDSIDRRSGAIPFRDWTPITYFKEIRESNVPIYNLAGWYDRYVRDQLIAYRNLSNPQRISIGPWTHTESDNVISIRDRLRR